MSLIYAIDYSADKLAIKGAPTEDSLTKKGPAEGLERVIVRDEIELGNLDPALLLRIANFKTKGALLTELPAVSEIWGMLSPPKRDKKKIEKKSSAPLTGSDDSATSSQPEGDSAKPGNTTETKVAKAKTKKASKKNGKGKGAKTAAKSANGLPREGSKAAKLLALISKPGGATFAEMKAATGWKEMRGTALTLARRAGKTLSMIKDKDGKKAPRWAAK
jgi:hypothetical protein